MRWFRFSIRSLVFAVVLVAVNCGALAAIAPYRQARAIEAVFGALPMGNLLAIMGYRRLVRGTATSPFFVGFALFGTIAVVVWITGCLTTDERLHKSAASWFAQSLQWVPFFTRASAGIVAGPSIFPRLYFLFVIAAIIWTFTALPQLLFALAGGWLSARLALVLKRRESAA